jgi:hypothetical protein
MPATIRPINTKLSQDTVEGFHSRFLINEVMAILSLSCDAARREQVPTQRVGTSGLAGKY